MTKKKPPEETLAYSLSSDVDKNKMYDSLISIITSWRDDNFSTMPVAQILETVEQYLSFSQSFEKRTSNLDNMLSLKNIEDLVANISKNQIRMLHEFAWQKVNEIDQNPLIVKKKMTTKTTE
jgi:hypothetical protein